MSLEKSGENNSRIVRNTLFLYFRMAYLFYTLN